ncbi:hypothetical protein [Flagellimonas sp.]|uniref:hypothetical protein n=1 Tax=Flagellimonas sp. TaxID=2058762 RepID=UPI003B5CAD20
MKEKFTFLLVVILGFSITSCLDFKVKKTEKEISLDDFKKVEINHEYQVSIPKYMRKTNSLNDDASLQCQNIFKETYLIIIDEPKDEFIKVFRELEQYNEELSLVENYREIQLQFFAENMKTLNASDPISLKINQLNAEMLEIDGEVEDIDEELTYFITFIEGDKKVYMIMAWTMASKKEEYRATFESASKSFGLIN